MFAGNFHKAAQVLQVRTETLRDFPGRIVLKKEAGRFGLRAASGTDQRFWRLAQALSALYPAPTEEKRWVDGVLARKKGLGF